MPFFDVFVSLRSYCSVVCLWLVGVYIILFSSPFVVLNGFFSSFVPLVDSGRLPWVVQDACSSYLRTTRGLGPAPLGGTNHLFSLLSYHFLPRSRSLGWYKMSSLLTFIPLPDAQSPEVTAIPHLHMQLRPSEQESSEMVLSFHEFLVQREFSQKGSMSRFLLFKMHSYFCISGSFFSFLSMWIALRFIQCCDKINLLTKLLYLLVKRIRK